MALPRTLTKVAELVPAVIEWNRIYLADLAGRPLDDDRVTLHEADVAQMISVANADYNAILLDVDNGPWALIRKENDWLYSLDGLNAAFAALRPRGVLAVWSSAPDRAFSRRLIRAGFDLEEVRVPPRGERKGGKRHIVWNATRN